MPKFTDSLIGENLEVATEYFKSYMASANSGKKGKTSGGSIGFIPFNFSFTMDGISGIKIYNELALNTSFLPSGYTKTLDFIVTGVDHKLKDGDWETDVKVTLIPKTDTIDEVITGSLSVKAQKESYTAPPPPVNYAPGPPGTPQPGSNETARANNLYVVPYGLSPFNVPSDAQTGAYKALLKTFRPPYPLIYSGKILNNTQKLVNKTTGVKETVKMSDLTYDYSTKLWTNASGTTYKNNSTLQILSLSVHKDVHDSLMNAFTQIQATYGMEQIWNLGLNTSAGSYVPRYKRGSSGELSMHSWGVAIDLLAGLNPLDGPNSASPRAQFSKPQYVKFINIMEQNGWFSLGKNSNYDWMHFQTVKY
jgi:hypothetical protein